MFGSTKSPGELRQEPRRQCLTRGVRDAPGWPSGPPGREASPGRSACRPAASPAPPRSARSGSRRPSPLPPSGRRPRLPSCAGEARPRGRGREIWSLEVAADATMRRAGGGALVRGGAVLTSPSADGGASGSVRVEPRPRGHGSAVLPVFSSVPDDLRRSLAVLREPMLRPLHRSQGQVLLVLQAVHGAVVLRALGEGRRHRRCRREERIPVSSYLLLAELVHGIAVDLAVGVAGEVTGTGRVCSGIWCRREGITGRESASSELKVQM